MKQREEEKHQLTKWIKNQTKNQLDNLRILVWTIIVEVDYFFFPDCVYSWIFVDFSSAGRDIMLA